MFTIPNILTFIRVLLIPIFVTVYFLDWQWAHQAGAFIFWLAGVTDWFDGYLARKLNQSTRFGAFLDPVADKLMVAAALLMITHSYSDLWITIPAIILLAREIFISALREWMADNGQSEIVSVSMWGKAKTMAQMTAIFGLLSHMSEWYWVQLGYVLLYVATILSIFSMVQYIQASLKTIKEADLVK